MKLLKKWMCRLRGHRLACASIQGSITYTSGLTLELGPTYTRCYRCTELVQLPSDYARIVSFKRTENL